MTREWHGPPLPTSFKTADGARALGDKLVMNIRRRTESGVGVSGAFPALSEGYAKAKSKAGLGAAANLVASGRMLNELQVTGVTSDGEMIIITFISGTTAGAGGAGEGTFLQRSRAVGGADKAYYHCVSGAGTSQVIRDFMQLGADDVDLAVAEAWRMIDAAIG